MNRRSPYDTLKTATWMAIFSAVIAFVVVSVGEASAQSRKSQSAKQTEAAQTVSVELSPAVVASTSRQVRIVYPAVVVAAR
jgi:hypothetical protein